MHAMGVTIIKSLLLAALLTGMSHTTAWCGGNGTVTIGNLVVLQDAGCLGLMSWVEADARAKNLAQGQCSLADSSKVGDWRLPTLNELQQIRQNPSGLINVQSGNYWSSTCRVQMWGPDWTRPVTICDSSSMSGGGGSQDTINKMHSVLAVRPVK
jgi:hypothetical protein